MSEWKLEAEEQRASLAQSGDVPAGGSSALAVKKDKEMYKSSLLQTQLGDTSDSDPSDLATTKRLLTPSTIYRQLPYGLGLELPYSYGFGHDLVPPEVRRRFFSRPETSGRAPLDVELLYVDKDYPNYLRRRFQDKSRTDVSSFVGNDLKKALEELAGLREDNEQRPTADIRLQDAISDKTRSQTMWYKEAKSDVPGRSSFTELDTASIHGDGTAGSKRLEDAEMASCSSGQTETDRTVSGATRSDTEGHKFTVAVIDNTYDLHIIRTSQDRRKNAINIFLEDQSQSQSGLWELEREREWELEKRCMIYQHQMKDKFFENLVLLLDTVGMSHEHRQKLNRFGYVRHAVLQSTRDPQLAVHVVYDPDSTDFVLTEMSQALETRAGLKLMLPDKGDNLPNVKDNSFLAAVEFCHCLLVVQASHYSHTTYQLSYGRNVSKDPIHKAIETPEYVGRQLMYVQRGAKCPDWVVNRLDSCIVMVYAHNSDRKNDFWDNLSFILRTPTMSREHRQKLNRFGYVRHAVLQSSRDPQLAVHVVYDPDSTNLVLTEMSQALETRAGLKLMLPDKGDNLPNVKDSPFLAALESCHCTLVVQASHGLFTRGNMPKDIFYKAVEGQEYAGRQLVFIQKEKQFPDWVVNRLDRYIVMVYPRGTSDSKNDFWDNLSLMLGTPTMSREHRQALNRFGYVRHAVLQSSRDPQLAVHVVYDPDSTNFVLTETSQALETRAGLKLMLPDKGDNLPNVKDNSFLAALDSCHCILVVQAPHYSRTKYRPSYKGNVSEEFIHKAIETPQYAGRQLMYVQGGEECPDWVINRLDRCIVMVYSHAMAYRENGFWDNLSFILRTPTMSREHRQKLNRFGYVRHAVLQSSRDPQLAVHVAYGPDSTDFVLTEISQALKMRAGLKLVLPDKGYNLPNVKDSPFLAALESCHCTLVVQASHGLFTRGNMPKDIIYKAVEGQEYAGRQLVYIQKKKQFPDWVVDRPDRCIVMVYPRGRSDSKNDFWDNLSLMLGTPTMSREHRQALNRFGYVRHAVLQSSRDPQLAVHVVYDPGSTNFVLTETSQALETRAGLKLMLPDKGDNLPNVKDNSFLDALDSCHCILVVQAPHYSRTKYRPSYKGNVSEFIHKAIETPQYAGRQLMYVQGGEECPDWVINRLDRCIVMVYSHAMAYRENGFWDNLSFLLGTPTMSREHRQALNRFGYVRHAVLQSSRDPQLAVHVAYGPDSTDFVLTEISQALKMRAGLKLVLPDKGYNLPNVKDSPFLAALESCHCTLVVQASHGLFTRGNMPKDITYKAVEGQEYAGRQLVYIQKKKQFPDWVVDRPDRCIVMVYPRGTSDSKNDFWDNLSLMLGTPTISREHRQKLNRFGYVRHAVLQSSRDPQLAVHVVYDPDSTDFVLTEISQALEMRAGLKLVLPDKGYNLPNVKDSPFLAALESCHCTLVVQASHGLLTRGNMPKDIIYKAVEGQEYAGRQLVYIQREKECPDWVVDRPDRCIVMVYPRGRSDSKNDFWDNLSLMLGTHAMSHKHRHWLNRFGYVRHAVLQSSSDPQLAVHVVYDPGSTNFVLTEISQALETRSGLKLMLPDKGYNLPNVEDNPFLAALESSHCTLVVQTFPYSRIEHMLFYKGYKREHFIHKAVDTPEYAGRQLVYVQRGEKCPDWVVDRLNRRDSCIVRVYPRNMPDRENDFWDNLSFLLCRQFQKDTELTPGLETGPEREQQTTPPPPIVSRSWQTVFAVSSVGGMFRKPGSDVLLCVPANAVGEARAVDIHSTVCTDVERVGRALRLQAGEEVYSPLVEYWAGHHFRFHRPVRITLPHFLPEDPDPAMVRLYRVDRQTDGQVLVTRLVQPPVPDPHLTGVCDPQGDVTALAPCYHGDRPTKRPEEPMEDDREGADGRGDCGTFQLSDRGTLIITTEHFCGYVCTYCGGRGPPVLNVLVCGGVTVMDASDHDLTADISAHIWDGRIHISDFRQDYGISSERSEMLNSGLLDVMPDLPDSRLHLRLVVSGRSCRWQYLADHSGKPMMSEEQHHSLRSVLTSCDSEDCKDSCRKTRPISVHWTLETRSGCSTTQVQVLQCVVNVSQVAADTTPVWASRQWAESFTRLPVKLRRKEQKECTTQTDHIQDAAHTADRRSRYSRAGLLDTEVVCPQSVSAAAGNQSTPDHSTDLKRPATDPATQQAEALAQGDNGSASSAGITEEHMRPLIESVQSLLVASVGGLSESVVSPAGSATQQSMQERGQTRAVTPISSFPTASADNGVSTSARTGNLSVVIDGNQGRGQISSLRRQENVTIQSPSSAGGGNTSVAVTLNQLFVGSVSQNVSTSVDTVEGVFSAAITGNVNRPFENSSRNEATLPAASSHQALPAPSTQHLALQEPPGQSAAQTEHVAAMLPQGAGSCQHDAGYSAQDAGDVSEEAIRLPQDAENPPRHAEYPLQGAGNSPWDAGNHLQDRGSPLYTAGHTSQGEADLPLGAENSFHPPQDEANPPQDAGNRLQDAENLPQDVDDYRPGNCEDEGYLTDSRNPVCSPTE